MKKIKEIKLIGLSLLLLIVSGCSLDEKWYSEITPNTYYTSKESVLAVLARPYTHAAWYLFDDRFFLQELSADQIVITAKGPHWYNDGLFQRLLYHEWTSEDMTVYNSWSGGMMGIALSLEVMEDLATLPDYNALGFTPEDKDDHLMQLQTLIAYFAMKTLDLFGGVPLFTSTKEPNKPRGTDIETFNHVEKLLLEAIPKLKKKETVDVTEEGSIKQATAAMMLAQLYLNAKAYIGQEKYEACAGICQDIINGVYGAYQLDPTWQGPFGWDNDKSPEIIWIIPSQTNKKENSWLYNYMGYNGSRFYLDVESNGSGAMHLSPSRNPSGDVYTEFRLGKPYEKFEHTDLRKKPYIYHGNKKYEGMFMVGVQTNPITGESAIGSLDYPGKILTIVDQVAHFCKVGTPEYPTVADLPSTIMEGEECSGVRLMKTPQSNIAEKSIRWNAHYPVFRLAEVYYMLAECKMRSGDKGTAASLINTVRRRNFEGGVDPDPVTPEKLDNYRMLDEWGTEFLGECRRRTDLIRWGLFTTENWWDHKAKGNDYLKRFPIPTQAMSGNSLLKQNPGYN